MDKESEKKVAGEKAAELVEKNATIGLGSGSTVKYFFKALAERNAREKLNIRGVATSNATTEYCEKLGINVVPFSSVAKIDMAFDGADEIDPRGMMIKGGGGAHLREKIVDYAAEKLVILIDSSKLVEKLGKFPVAVEFLEYGKTSVEKQLGKLCKKVVLREGFKTDNDNPVFDAFFGEIKNPEKLEQSLNQIPGVLENGVFTKKPYRVVLGTEKGPRLLNKNSLAKFINNL